MSDATQDFVNNIPGEEDLDSVKIQKVDDATDVQHTTKSATMKEKKNYSLTFVD